MTENDRQSCLSYLNKFVGQNNNTFHYSSNKKPINTDYSALNEKNLNKS